MICVCSMSCGWIEKRDVWSSKGYVHKGYWGKKQQVPRPCSALALEKAYSLFHVLNVTRQPSKIGTLTIQDHISVLLKGETSLKCLQKVNSKPVFLWWLSNPLVPCFFLSTGWTQRPPSKMGCFGFLKFMMFVFNAIIFVSWCFWYFKCEIHPMDSYLLPNASWRQPSVYLCHKWITG